MSIDRVKVYLFDWIYHPSNRFLGYEYLYTQGVGYHMVGFWWFCTILEVRGKGENDN